MSVLTSIGTFLQKTLDSSEAQSFGRFAALLTLCFCLGWDTAYLAFVMKFYSQYHFSASDILPAAGTLLAQGGFATLFYASSKYGDILKDKNDSK